MLARLVFFSVRNRVAMATTLAVLLLGGGFAAKHLPIDALPDVSTIQATVLTEAPGLSPVEVERMVTLPLERALNGLPSLVELRSVSRPGLSAVTCVFKDGTDVWFARQLVAERLREAQPDLPSFGTTPQLAPVSTGLGEIFIFVVASERHSPAQLRSLLDWEIGPKLKSVPGVIEVNGMGGELKQYQVRVDPVRLQAFGLTLREVREALERASGTVGAGYLERGSESLLVRGIGLLRSEDEIRSVVLKVSPDGTPILVAQVAEVTQGAALRYGVTTRDGKGEVVTGTVMMLLGANSRDVIKAVKEKVNEVRDELPTGVELDPVYDRSDFVGRTLTTVGKNLLEGVVVVFLVLTLLLGTVRGAIAVVLGVPASMSVALFSMHLFGVTGDLMSLGAIDFGFLVDGPVVMLEAVVAALAGRRFAQDGQRMRATAEATGAVVRPVVFSVAIILLVYFPLFALEGVEGKMFRPMASVMASALFGALVYAVLFFPALLALLLPAETPHGPHWLAKLTARYERLLPWALAWRWPLAGATSMLLVVFAALLLRQGANFVPRIDEGDAVLTIRRAPSIALSEARKLDLKVQKILHRFPEVVTALAFTGRAELAFDPVGNDNTDLLVHLRPKSEWKTAKDLDGLSVAFKEAVEKETPGTFVSVSQPIEDRTNELISGSRADVAIQLYGPELVGLAQLSQKVADEVRRIDGTGDVRVERVLGMPTLRVQPDRQRLARYGVKLEELFAALEAARQGSPVGVIYEGEKRFDLRLLVPPHEATPTALGELRVETASGTTVPLSELATLVDTEGPAQVRREGMTRTLRVEVNLRGRDLVSWVDEARARVAKAVPMPPQYELTWGGQFENFERARARLGIVVPLAMAIIFGMLAWTFTSLRLATAVFALVPLALAGGMAGLVMRGMPFSIPAAVGFIALAGVAVLNGVVMTSDAYARARKGVPSLEAVRLGAVHTFRAVLTTALVAALGFAPMAISMGAGSEVQQPLATVVIAGIIGSTALMLLVFPGILAAAIGARPLGVTRPRVDPNEEIGAA